MNLLFSSADLLCVWLASRIATGLRGNQQQVRLLQRIGAGLLVLLGAWLATS